MSPSPIRYRGTWKLHKRASEADRWLEEMGFYRKRIARDSSCLFRAVCENIYNSQRLFPKVREDCVKFMSSNKNLFKGFINCPYDIYLNDMSNPSEYGGFTEISAMSHLYRRDFVIFEAYKESQTTVRNGYGTTIFLFYAPDMKHFDVVYTKDFIDRSSFCQSLVYELLYESVFLMQDVHYAVDKMLYDKLPSNHIEYYMSDCDYRKKQKDTAKILIETFEEGTDSNNNALSLKCKHHTEDIEKESLLKDTLSILVLNRSFIHLENICLLCLNVNSAKDLWDNGITPFPYKVAKALDPNIYRNIEFDVWSELRRELRYGGRYSDGTTLQVGVKCLCKLRPDQSIPYHCHIQDMTPEGPCSVFIEELGEMKVVGHEQLEPLPREEVKPWAPPYRYSRTHSQFFTITQILQQLGNMTRKQGMSKVRKGKATINGRTPSEMKSKRQSPQITWKDEFATYVKSDEDNSMLDYPPYAAMDTIDFSAYHHLDFFNFVPFPVEITALPLMVDCRPSVAGGAGSGSGSGPGSNGNAGPNEHDKHNGPASQPPPPQHQPNLQTNDNHLNQGGPSGDMGAGMPPTSSPAAGMPLAHHSYAGMGGYGMNMGACPPPYMYGVGAVGGMAEYGKGGVMWCPPAPPPQPVPPGVNPCVYKSVQTNGADLPMNDIPTLRYYFNLGVECAWLGYVSTPPPPPALSLSLPPPPAAAPSPVPAPPPPQPRGYHPQPPPDLMQGLQQLSLSEGPRHKPPGHHHEHKHGPSAGVSGSGGPGKGGAQRPLLGPRFKRGTNHQDGHSMNQGKTYNNHNNIKIQNNSRRNSHGDPRSATHGVPYTGECVEAPMMPLPYMPYPPVYQTYYPIEHDTGLVSMMGGYVGYDDNVEYINTMPHYYAPSYPPPAAMPPQQPPPPQPQHQQQQQQPQQQQQQPPAQQQQQHNMEHK